MNASDLAKLILEYEAKARELAAIRTKITESVLESQSSQKVGNVKVGYSKGRTTYDYETPGMTAAPAIIAKHTEPVTNWKAVCEDAGLEAPVLKTGEPSVSITIEGLKVY